MPRRVVDVKGQASFRSQDGRWWRSSSAWAKFRLVKSRTDVRCVKTYFQLPKNNTGTHARPRFNDDEWERMKQEALRKLLAPPNVPAPQPFRCVPFDLTEETPPHQVDLCEKCQELGYPCTRAGQVIEDYAGQQFCIDRYTAAARRKRLRESETKSLYHQTDDESAQRILKTKSFCPGRTGLAGGGIYFAVTPYDTHHKANKHGVILRAQVKLGRVLKLTAEGDPNMTLERLLQRGYDSVMIPRPGGTEYVVYIPEQVLGIEVYQSRGGRR